MGKIWVAHTTLATRARNPALIFLPALEFQFANEEVHIILPFAFCGYYK